MGLHQAIAHLLNHPEQAKAQAQHGYELLLKERNSDGYVEAIANRLIHIMSARITLKKSEGEIGGGGNNQRKYSIRFKTAIIVFSPFPTPVETQNFASLPLFLKKLKLPSVTLRASYSSIRLPFCPF